MGIIALLKILVSLTPYLPLIMKSWAGIEKLLKLLKDTPEEKREKVLAAVHAASVLATETGGDTSGYEDVIRRGGKPK